LGEAAIAAGASPKNARNSGYQLLKQLRGKKVPEVMDELGLSRSLFTIIYDRC